MNGVTNTGLNLTIDIFGNDRSTDWWCLGPPLRGFGLERFRFPGFRNVRLRLTLLHWADLGPPLRGKTVKTLALVFTYLGAT